MIKHIPVLYQEVLDLLQPRSGGFYIDGTVGAGGHTSGLLDATSPDGMVLGLDRDQDALDFSRGKLARYGNRVILVQASFAKMDMIARNIGFNNVDGIMLDLGLSSRQLADENRGFSFLGDGPLDMRFDPTTGKSAAELINESTSEELATIFWRYGEVRQNRKLAQAIVDQRPIFTTKQLADLISQHTKRKTRIHPATLIFQALRIAVNEELEALGEGLIAATSLLKSGGRLAVISFHSLEDRLVKNFIREQSLECICPPHQPICNCDKNQVLRAVTRKIIRPSESEVKSNPRSRSARLRVAEKV